MRFAIWALGVLVLTGGWTLMFGTDFLAEGLVPVAIGAAIVFASVAYEWRP